MAEEVTLLNCDTEPIHIPGKIQQHGVLLAIHSSIVTHVSDNIETYFKLKPVEVLNKNIEEVLSQIGIQNQVDTINILEKEGQNLAPKRITTTDGKQFHLICHKSAGFVILEFEIIAETEASNNEEIMNAVLVNILNATSLQSTLQYAAAQIKDIIHYDRVMIYKFAPDGHGEVVAESVNDGFEPFFGLHYPATDIPAQARELYKKNLVRIISDVHTAASPIVTLDETLAPLDLSDSVLRAVSPIHIQYLKNMGVDASFSVSILADGELWGLIACHNYSPRIIDYKNREKCKVISQLLSTSLIFREKEHNKEQKILFNQGLLTLLKHVRQDADLADALLKHDKNLLSITEATGAALIYDGQINLLGETPTQEQVKELAAWLSTTNRSNFFLSTKLGNEFPPATSYPSAGAGVMAIILSKEMNECIIWFRPEIKKNIVWAGKPEKEIEKNAEGLMALSPRKSFESYIQLAEGSSDEWNNNEISIVMQLREELASILNEKANQVRRLNEQLRLAYDELDTFSFTISHDLKTPLASIKNYTEILAESLSEDLEFEKGLLAKIVKGADRMNLLINEVLSYSRLTRQPLDTVEIDMTKLLQELIAELQIAYLHIDHEIIVKEAPPISGDFIMIYQVFSNLLTNAIKYGKPDIQSKIEVSGTVTADGVLYVVSDNGIGIDMKSGDQIFELFKRMNNSSSVVGTGVGLAIVKRIIQKHGGSIRYESDKNKGTSFYISFKNERK